MTSRLPTTGALVVTLCLALPGCDGESGILITVSGGALSEIELHVGVSDGRDFLLQPEISSHRVDVRGRNLRTDPYNLFLREGASDGAPARVRVIALGYWQRDGRLALAGFGVTDPPQPFVRGEVVQRPIRISGFSTNYSVSALGKSCFFARISSKKQVAIISKTDRDCDGSANNARAADCDDANASIYPGARELCDGVDNNCDKKYAPARYPCYAMKGDGCFRGSRPCGDARGQGVFGICEPGQRGSVSTLYCQAYVDCKSKDPLVCALAVREQSVRCTLEILDGGVFCDGAKITLRAPSSSACRWTVEDQAGYSVKLGKPGGPPLSTIEACRPELRVGHGANPPAPRTAVVQFNGNPKTLLSLTITPKVVGKCSKTPLVCK